MLFSEVCANRHWQNRLDLTTEWLLATIVYQPAVQVQQKFIHQRSTVVQNSTTQLYDLIMLQRGLGMLPQQENA